MKTKYNLPDHIIAFPNPDKEFQEEIPNPDNDLMFIPHSSRIIFYGW